MGRKSKQPVKPSQDKRLLALLALCGVMVIGFFAYAALSW
jgi:hypothetical protein